MRSTLFILTLLSFASAFSQQDLSLDGIWQVPCKQGLAKHQYIHNSHVFSVESFFSDRDCNKISFRFDTIGTNSFPSENSLWINFTFQEIRLSVFVQAVVDDFNLRKVCGLSDWKFGEAQTITGLKCALFNYNKETQIPRAGDRKFGIFSINEDKLFYGVLTRELDGSTAEKRPTMLSEDYYLRISN
jgi:hypothetical protein